MWDVVLGETGVECDVLLDRSEPERRFRIRSPTTIYIYGVQYGNSPNFKGSRGMLYDEREVLSRTLKAFTDKLKTQRSEV